MHTKVAKQLTFKNGSTSNLKHVCKTFFLFCYSYKTHKKSKQNVVKALMKLTFYPQGMRNV